MFGVLGFNPKQKYDMYAKKYDMYDIIDIGHHKYAIYVGLSLELLRIKVIVECIDQYHK